MSDHPRNTFQLEDPSPSKMKTREAEPHTCIWNLPATKASWSHGPQTLKMTAYIDVEECLDQAVST